MSKWEKEYKDYLREGLPCTVEAFKGRQFKVKMRGWARLLLIGNKKIIDDKGNGSNRWRGKNWGKFKVFPFDYWTVRLSYERYGIVDYVHNRPSGEGYVGDFRMLIKGKIRHIAWFTLEEVRGG